MRWILTAAFLTIVSTCLADDPIAALTADLNSQVGGLWINGTYPILEVSSNAPASQIIISAAKAWHMVERANDLKILETRDVQLNGPSGPPWKAALVEVPSGRKILLFRSEGNDHWWTRFYDVTNNVPNWKIQHAR